MIDPGIRHTWTLGGEIPLLWDHGPISFGTILRAERVAWSAADAKDVLISRCWEGVFLYPTRNLADEELNRPPIRVMGSPFTPTVAMPLDWNRDGQDDLLASDREGFMYLCRREGSYPDVSFEPAGALRDWRTGLAFNFPFINPEHSVEQMGDLGGYIDPYFYNSTFPAVYPLAPGRLDLIVGDWAGNLWWLPDESGGTGEPRYSGVPYTKPERDTTFARKYYSQFGREYAMPRGCVRDEDGKPFVLGAGVDGTKVYRGANTRPLPYLNPDTGALDLLVLAGHVRQELHYLERVNPGETEAPVFCHRGEIPIEGLPTHPMGFHTGLMPLSPGPAPDLCLTCANMLMFLERRSGARKLPAYIAARTASAVNSPAFAGELSAILTDAAGSSYLLNNPGTHWELYPLKRTPAGTRLGWPAIPLLDQNGLFTVEAETDPNIWMSWGYHRATLWNFDGSGRQHLIVGTDKGLLYLLIDEGGTGRDGEFRFRSAGPLKDTSGSVIRIHNRVCAAAIDLDGDGRQDLIAGGVTYQLGLQHDPDPGGGFYVLLHQGLDAEGLPILAPPRPLETPGVELNQPVNAHVQLQALDLDGDGEKEVILCIQSEPWLGRVFRPTGDGASLAFTGTVLDSYVLEHILLDIDGDGEYESVFGGSEQGIARYRKLVRD